MPRSRIGDGDDFPFLGPGGQLNRAQVAGRRAAQRPGERTVPADPAGAGIGLIVADQCDGAARILLVREFDRGAEPSISRMRLRP